MKKIMLSMALLATVSLHFSCYKEDAIAPSSSASSGQRYTFPQGTEEQDDIAKQVYDKFGVKIIYKGFKNSHFNLKWTDVGTVTGNDIPADQQKEAVKFIADNIFGLLTPQVTKGILPMYFYVADSVAGHSVLGSPPTIISLSNSSTTYISTGLDFWSFCWNGVRPYNYYPQDATKGYQYSPQILAPRAPNSRTTSSGFYRRGVLLKEVINKAINKGIIKVPEGFNDGIDFTTRIVNTPGTETDPNYYKNRGFPGRMSNAFRFDMTFITQPTNGGPGTNPQQNFIDYVDMAMRYAPGDSLNTYYPPSLCPIIHQKYPIVVQYMKDKYNIDLVKIATNPNP